MSLEIITFELDPLSNNTYLLINSETKGAALIDPSFNSQIVIGELRKRGCKLEMILLTHAHFDHIAGIVTIQTSYPPSVPIGLHPADLELYHQGGGSEYFGIQIPPAPEPVIKFYHGQNIHLGAQLIEVRHTPGHTRGHVVFYSLAARVVFCGDLIFNKGVGRTDIPGGDEQALLRSIQTQILTLPPETRLLSGHGPETTVGEESQNNPYLLSRV